MLSLQRVKQLLNYPSISDDTALEIRDSFRSLAEIIFEQWEKQKGVKQNNENEYEIPDPKN